MTYDPLNQVHPGPLEGIDRIHAGWKPISSAPKTDRALLLGYWNSHGKWRTVRGQWMSAECIGQEWEDPDDVEAGWFETAVEADDVPNCWRIEPTHWMPLPAAPGANTPEEPVTVALDPDPRGVSVGVWQGSRCIYTGAHPLPAAPGSPESAAPGDAPEPIKLMHLAVAWEIRSPAMPASVELTPFVARAQEAWQQGFEVHDLVRRVSAPVAAQAAPPVASAEPVAWPRVFGVSRDLHPRCLMISLAQEPTDDQMRAIHDALRRAPVAAQQSNKTGTNSGHGHVWDRPDGLKAKCGGPGFCSQCSRDQAAQQGKGGAA